jgi:FMN phosphatase YigB (HAD superfamily)
MGYNRRMSSLSTVFFDFDGVLCKDRFYTTLQPDYPHVMRFVNEAIFGGEQKYADRWMRGEFTYQEINRLIADSTGIPFGQLSELFLASVRQMRLNQAIIQFAEKLKQRGAGIAMVTNNMDIFNEVTVPEKGLDKVFPVIVNSFDHRIMKHDENGRLFDLALGKLGLASYQGAWLIDDSPLACATFETKGGRAYHYSDQANFEQWVEYHM